MKHRFYNKLCRVITAVLFVGLYCTEPARAEEETMGLTVSRAPAAGWVPSMSGAASKKTLWFTLLAIGGVMAFTSAAFLKIKKIKGRTEEIQNSTEPEINAQPIREIPPAQPPKPEYKMPPFKGTSAPPPEEKPEPPPVEKTFQYIPPAVNNPIETKQIEDEDDILLKHLDLLRHLKDESEK